MFTYKHNLKTHELSKVCEKKKNSHEKSDICNVCGKKFSNHANMKTHLKRCRANDSSISNSSSLKQCSMPAPNISDPVSFPTEYNEAVEWLMEMEKLIANQKPVSAVYEVAEAQWESQIFLQKLMSDRQQSMLALFGVGQKIAGNYETEEETRIHCKLKELIEWFDVVKRSTQERAMALQRVMQLASDTGNTSTDNNSASPKQSIECSTTKPLAPQPEPVDESYVQDAASFLIDFPSTSQSTQPNQPVINCTRNGLMIDNSDNNLGGEPEWSSRVHIVDQCRV